ncbi:GNAT family N-acetyltransferase [Pyxidicoccus fallax]|uniref:GNAT family N-acetyltransferase n=1 Tax=Pyxidicoccus fallax TaxID=394095 RepID=A0A848LJ39_9BACT|nr:GNAT family N-acetyltransferase [Pyxidicoccus fallax]NMO17757.1 GNAT family N-acetyltransferase [Pyxidicoccus fallax]NPC78220.1 GNAT family N-acetyltransferase [Pyxidicoccus fallax]
MIPPLVLLGSGYTLTRLAVAEARVGRDVLAATRDAARRRELEDAGARVTSLDDALTRTAGAHVVVSVPPDAGLDERIAGALAQRAPARLVYLSSTGVYGAARGHVDEDTPVDPSWPAARDRIEAESRYLPLGARVLRIAGIYGPGRSTLSRLLAGAVRLPEGGGGRISRVHVDDLVEAIRVVLQRGEPGAFYCVADERPASQTETVTWLCQRLGMPLPPTVPLESLHESLRGDRAVSNARLKDLGWQPRYPDYVAGFTALLKAEGRATDPESLTLRRLRPDEAEVFWGLRLRGLREHPEAFGASLEEDEVRPMEVVRARLGAASQVVLGAFDGERLVGVAGLRREDGRKVAHKAVVWGMYVLPEYRSRGVGRRLLVGIIEEGRRMAGVERLLLTVVAGNASAQALYRSLGFQTYGVEPAALKIGEAHIDKELMCLPL